jgi:two-component system, sensor histidine kinase and response regulator
MSHADPVLPGRLLVVDDEPGLVTALLSTLREHGYEAVGATNPADALARLRRERFDVMLTDVHLPEMDGVALLRAALAIDPGLIGIMMTGHGVVDTAVDAMKAGAVDYVLKPFKLKSVLAVLARALAMRQLREENEALQQRLRRRTQELEAANRELEAFSYSVSHDLRSPLRTIEGFTEALIDEIGGGSREKVEEYAGRIRRVAKRMGSLIDDLLHMAKAVRGELVCAPVNLEEMAREILAKLHAQAPERELELGISGELIATGDAGLLRLAMENLLGNAWKYTAQVDRARVEVGGRKADGETIVSVRDNGVGFDMSEIGQLFVPFRRLRSARGFEGTGVGLATVQRIVQRHGGRIWAESEPGKGAVFFFSLPDVS